MDPTRSNPYQSAAVPLPTNPRQRRTFLLRYPATVAATVLMLAGVVNFGHEHYRMSVDLEQKGISTRTRSTLDLLAIPGVVCLYVIGTVTNSPAAGWAAFLVGMLITYLGAGGLLDLLVHQIRRCFELKKGTGRFLA